MTKHGLDAFEGTDLHDHLNREGVTDVVGAGLSTAHGVAATAGVDEAQHRAALGRLTALGARTKLTADLVAAEAGGN